MLLGMGGMDGIENDPEANENVGYYRKRDFFQEFERGQIVSK